ncbi:unnamed protein product [Closterium sp. NIES-54]
MLSRYIIEEDFTLESERRKDQLLPQVNYVASKQQHQQQKWGKSRRGGDKSEERSSGGKRNSQRNCFVCGDPEHFANQCPDCVNKKAGDGQEAPYGRSQNRQLRRETAYREDNQHSDSEDKQPSDAGTSRGKGVKDALGDDVDQEGQASCSMAVVVTDASAELTISVAPKAGEDFQAVAAAVQANPTVVLLDNGCSNHLMGTREAFVNMNAGGEVHHSADDDEGRPDALRIGIVDGQLAAFPEVGAPGMRKSAPGMQKPEPGMQQLAGEQVTGEQTSSSSSSNVVEVISEAARQPYGESSSSDVVEIKPPTQHSTRSNFGVPPKKWADVCPVFANMLLDDAKSDTTLPELDPDMYVSEVHW